jgi:2-oxoglutarate dehydrogenase E1 component
MMSRNRKTSFLYGGNAPYVEAQYEHYLADPDTVGTEWRDYFDALRAQPAVDGSDVQDVPHTPMIEKFAGLAKRRPPAGAAGAPSASLQKQLAIKSLVAGYRSIGARSARLDPLGWIPVASQAELAPANHGLVAADMAIPYEGGDTFFGDSLTLGQLVQALDQTYCGPLSAEVMHLSRATERLWWQARLESTRANPMLPADKLRQVLQQLTAAEGLEKYLHARYVGQKRFSLEGGETLVVLLDELLEHGASQGIRKVVMGMAHRGRLNVLVNVVGKPAQDVFDEFEGRADPHLQAGDVKYHKGFVADRQTPHGSVEVTLAFNPSHLEIVNPVVQGMARARAEEPGQSARTVLPVEIHGDAAIAGQGIVMETLSLSYTREHGTGGAIHVVVNNQVGFTSSDPREARSSFFCTDIAKMIEAPVLHVNGDDPQAVVLAARLAMDYRAAFGRSVVIELVCFRRHGHQEQDTPGITQPLMYRAIAAHPGVRSLYAQQLIQQEVVTAQQALDYVQVHREGLEETRKKENPGKRAPADAPPDVAMPRHTVASLRTLAHRITDIPESFQLHPLVAKVVASRREMAEGRKPLDWGMAEHLAFASLLAGGRDVRLSGQDSERGTFGHRHAVLHDQGRKARAEGMHVPLQHVAAEQGKFCVTNSVLSEAAVMAFEYGYAVLRSATLVLWEAQFGDFANGAQVVIDQFIAAGEAKWGQQCGLTLLLPHGQEGQGPEHASARLERYLQLCARDNMRVCQPTTPAQFFHLLHDQACAAPRRPLIVLTPKSLLRHAAAVSSLEDLATGAYQPLIADAEIPASQRPKVLRVVLCTGKIYYELAQQRRGAGQIDVALVRFETLYPFPAQALQDELARYPNAESLVWCQDEPQNQGAWRFIEPRLRALVPSGIALAYAGPMESASTAPGSPAVHAGTQREVVGQALATGTIAVAAETVAVE